MARIREWLRKVWHWNVDHRAAWAGFTDPGVDGLTRFQKDVERQLSEALASRGLSLVNRRIEADPLEPFVNRSRAAEPLSTCCLIVAEVPKLGAKVWIARDQIDIHAPSGWLRLEKWDSKAPQDHFDATVAFVSSLPFA